MNNFWQDLRYGARILLKKPGFTLIAIFTLALGIGANTAIFSVVNSVLLRALPFHEPDRLVMIWEDASFAGFPRNTPAPANYSDWKAQNQVFEAMAAIDERSFNLTGDSEPERVVAQGVTADFFPMLGIQPLLGRAFLPEEDRPGANKAIILSYGLWQRRYGGDRGIIGRELLLNGETYTVVGVMPAGFQFLNSYIRLWVPMAFTPQQLAQRSSHYLQVVGRMKQDVSLEQASAEIQSIQQGIGRDHPNEAGRISAYALSLHEQVAGDIRRPLLVLLVAVGFVLAVACANIANLLLSRAASRQREIAVRLAMGATRWRIIRQLLTESVLLSIFGASLGVLFAWWSFDFLRHLIPDGLALSIKLDLDMRVLLYTLLLSLATGIIFGSAPALQTSQIDLNESLKQSGGRTGLSRGGSRLRSAMVVAEVALALVLLVGAGLLIQTFFNLRNQYSVLQPENVLIFRTQLPSGKYREPSRGWAFYEQVIERVKSLPGVVSAGYTTTIPLEWKGGTSGFYPEGLTVEEARARGLSYDANHRQVSADYLQAMGISLRQGRYLKDSDNEQTMSVAVINETMARQYWPGEEAVGKHFQLGDPSSDKPWITIVGIAADVRQMGPDEPVKAEMYFPYRQVRGYQFFSPRDLVIRASTAQSGLTAAVQGEIHAVDADQPISNIRTMEETVGEEIASRRLSVTLLAAMASLALLLAMLGIYGVLSWFVAQQTSEIGVRLALGAQRRDVMRLVLKKGMRPALTGIVIGLGAALALTRLMTSLLFEVRATDPVTFIGVPLILTAVALAACYIPAWRATRVDPMTALRYE
ncbi:MAG: ABC transporter permease [Acidobacteriota bacterium]